MPQVNEEYGYEDHYPQWCGNRKWPARTADNRRRLAWSMVMAGGYQTTGERADTGTGWGADTGGGWINGRGDDSMVMLPGYAHMVEFFTRIPWWTLNPDEDLIVMPDRPASTTNLTHIVYTFREGRGDIVRDISETGPPLNLKIEKLEAVRWLPDGGLRIESPTLIASAAAADKIVQAIDRSGELTIEAWVQPANTTQSGPARIVTCSADPSRRNFTLGQAEGDFEVRFRTATTSPNGEPSLWSSSRDDHAGPPVCARRSDSGDLAVLYFASGGQVTLDRSKLAEPLRAEWYNPRDGSSRGANSVQPNTYRAPDEEDCLLLLRKP